MTNYYYTFDFDELAAISEAFLTNDVLGGDDYFAYPPTTLWGRSPAVRLKKSLTAFMSTLIGPSR